MAMPMTLIIVAGEIDLSVESMAGLASAILGFLWAAGVPLWIGIPVVLVVGALGGLLNGLLVARGGLPSLVVTLGTLALFRGLALIVLGPRGVSDFPAAFTELGFGHVPGTLIPWPFVIFLGLALVLGIVLHRTWIGRQVYAIGKNTGAARFSGVRVTRVRVSLFVLSGLIAALAGHHPDVAPVERPRRRRDGHDPDGRHGRPARRRQHLRRLGHDPGRRPRRPDRGGHAERPRLANVTVEVQSIALGLLLILSVVIPTFAHQAKSAIDRVRGGRPPPADSVAHGEGAPS